MKKNVGKKGARKKPGMGAGRSTKREAPEKVPPAIKTIHPFPVWPPSKETTATLRAALNDAKTPGNCFVTCREGVSVSSLDAADAPRIPLAKWGRVRGLGGHLVTLDLVAVPGGDLLLVDRWTTVASKTTVRGVFPAAWADSIWSVERVVRLALHRDTLGSSSSYDATFLDLEYSTPALRSAVSDAFLAFAMSRSEQEIRDATNLLEQFPGQPRQRSSAEIDVHKHNVEGGVKNPEDSSPAPLELCKRWLAAVTNPEHVVGEIKGIARANEVGGAFMAFGRAMR